MTNELMPCSTEAEVKEFARHGLPPLAPQNGSKSGPSVATAATGHDPAVIQQAPFASIQGIFDSVRIGPQQQQIWTKVAGEWLSNWSSEADTCVLVRAVVLDAILAVGLGSVLRCHRELSVFHLCADIWILVKNTGTCTCRL